MNIILEIRYLYTWSIYLVLILKLRKAMTNPPALPHGRRSLRDSLLQVKTAQVLVQHGQQFVLLRVPSRRRRQLRAGVLLARHVELEGGREDAPRARLSDRRGQGPGGFVCQPRAIGTAKVRVPKY